MPEAPGTFAPPAPQTSGDDDNALINQFIQMITSAGGGGGPTPGNLGGGNPVMDMLGMGMGGDALGMGMGGMGMPPMQGGLYPDQMARLQLTRNNQVNALRQNMANQHRAVGRAGGTDYSRHVQNIDNSIEQLAMQDMRGNIDQMMKLYGMNEQYAAQNLRNNLELMKLLGTAGGFSLRYGGNPDKPGETGQPGTFAPEQESDAGS